MCTSWARCKTVGSTYKPASWGLSSANVWATLFSILSSINHRSMAGVIGDVCRVFFGEFVLLPFFFGVFGMAREAVWVVARLAEEEGLST